jgi:hypothetical protein
MAIASLRNFTVPLPTNQTASTQGLLMPKLQYRFRVSFDGLGVSAADLVELTKQVVSFNRPTVNFVNTDIHVYNSVVRLAGKHEWGDCSITLRDDAGNNISRLIGEQLQKQFDFYEQASASAGLAYKFKTRCEMLDGGNGVHEPRILETWELYGCYIREANYQEVNYANSDPVQIQLSIRFDNAIQTDATGTTPVGIGRNIGRAIEETITG